MRCSDAAAILSAIARRALRSWSSPPIQKMELRFTGTLRPSEASSVPPWFQRLGRGRSQAVTTDDMLTSDSMHMYMHMHMLTCTCMTCTCTCACTHVHSSFAPRPKPFTLSKLKRCMMYTRVTLFRQIGRASMLCSGPRATCAAVWRP